MESLTAGINSAQLHGKNHKEDFPSQYTAKQLRCESKSFNIFKTLRRHKGWEHGCSRGHPPSRGQLNETLPQDLRGLGMRPETKCLPNMQEALGSSLAPHPQKKSEVLTMLTPNLIIILYILYICIKICPVMSIKNTIKNKNTMRKKSFLLRQ
jgi:hypothetical protein